MKRLSILVVVTAASAAGEQIIELSRTTPMLVTDFDVYSWQHEGDLPYHWPGRPVPPAFSWAVENEGVTCHRRNDWHAHYGFLAAPNTGRFHIVWEFRFADPGRADVTTQFRYYADAKRASKAFLHVSNDGRSWREAAQVGQPDPRRAGWHEGAMKHVADVTAGQRMLLKVVFQDHGIWTPPKLRMQSLKVTFVPPVARDRDRDGVDDKLERKHFRCDMTQPDTDGDGLSDFEETMLANSRPNLIDTDGDLLDDYKELLFSSDPNLTDSDRDGLTDAEEYALGSNPRDADTDGDSLSDLDELGWSDMLLRDTDRDGQPDAQDSELLELKRRVAQVKTLRRKPGQLAGIHAEALTHVDDADVSLKDFAAYLKAFNMNYVMVGLWSYGRGANWNLKRLARHLATLNGEGITVSLLVMRAGHTWDQLVPALAKHPNFQGLILDEPINIERFYGWADEVNRRAGRKIAMVNFSPTLCEKLSAGKDWRGEVAKAKRSGKFAQIWADPYGPHFVTKVLFHPDIDGILPYTYIGPRESASVRYTAEHAVQLNKLVAKLCLLSGKHFAYYNIGRFVSLPHRGAGGWRPAAESILSVLNPGGRIPEKFRQKSFQAPWNWRSYPKQEMRILR